MRAMIIPEFGGPDLFERKDVKRPEPGPGEVLVRQYPCVRESVKAEQYWSIG